MLSIFRFTPPLQSFSLTKHTVILGLKLNMWAVTSIVWNADRVLGREALNNRHRHAQL